VVDQMTVKFAQGLKEHLTELWGPPGNEDFSLYADDLEFKDPLVLSPLHFNCVTTRKVGSLASGTAYRRP